MASRRTSIERRHRAHVAAALVWSTLAIAVVIGAGRAGAHDIPRTAMRELVRLQGFVTTPKAGELILVVRGRELSFRVTDRQVFLAVAAASRRSQPEPGRLVLQGDPGVLARLADARPEQRVTILGERRPGGDELFVAALDLCPE